METATTLINVAQFLITLTAIITAVVYIHQDLRSHVTELRNDIERQNKIIDKQSERTDKLYEMFIELLKK